MPAARPRVVIVGAGFGGVEAAHNLARADVDVVIIDRQNHHLFQPLLYQVATAGLSPANIAWPIRALFRRQRNVRVVMAEVRSVDLATQVVMTDEGEEKYDQLIIATGMVNGWFGRDDWAEHAHGLKTLDEAMGVRNEVLSALEQAELETDPVRRKALMTMVVIGGGPTGVEMAGSLAELTRRVLNRDFDRINPAEARIVLIEAGDRLLNGFCPDLSQETLRALQDVGVEVRLKSRVQDIRDGIVQLEGELLGAATILWAAGVQGTPVASWLGAEADRMGRVIVDSRCRPASLTDQQNVYVIGDIAHFKGEEGHPLPGVATVAMQQGKYVAELIQNPARTAPFVYKDPGSMATIGRHRAVVQKDRLRLTGFVAWLAWLFVHLIKLMSMRNKVLVFVQWTWSYLTWERGARLITGRTPKPRRSMPVSNDSRSQ